MGGTKAGELVRTLFEAFPHSVAGNIRQSLAYRAYASSRVVTQPLCRLNRVEALARWLTEAVDSELAEVNAVMPSSDSGRTFYATDHIAAWEANVVRLTDCDEATFAGYPRAYILCASCYALSLNNPI